MTIGADRRDLVGDLRQLASVRRILFDEGAERGVAALAFSTGGGLDFWVLADRAMDIGPLWSDGRPVAWQSPGGFRHPSLVDPEGDEAHGFGRGFSGFLMTCGLDHTRGPLGAHPQHGRLAFLPARLTAFGENWKADEPHLFCEGEIIQYRHSGESLALVRRIEAAIGGRILRIRDRVENRGIVPQRNAMLYHFNLGYPALQPGAEVWYGGERVFGPLAPPDATQQPNAFSMPATSAMPCALKNGTQTILDLSFSAATLPHLQVWHDPRPRGFVLALEPCTSARPEHGQPGQEPVLEPGETRNYEISVSLHGWSS